MALVAMAFLWTGSQIPAYLYGGVPPYSKSSQSRHAVFGYLQNIKFMETLEEPIDGLGSSWAIYSPLVPFVHSLVVYQISLDVELLPYSEHCSS
jgi:hypothetical protein